MKIDKYYSKVYYNNSLYCKIPIIDIGDITNGFGCLICQLHGDEYSSLLIARSLVKRFRDKRKPTRIGLRIILSANPIASKLSTKTEPISGLNLNRLFDNTTLVDKSATPANLIAVEILKQIKGSTFCVDIHDMPKSLLPVCCILTITGNKSVEKKNIEIVKKIKPEVVWTEDSSKSGENIRYAGTINRYLNSLGIPNATIETSPINGISPQTIKSVSEKLASLMDNAKPTNVGLNLLIREEVYTKKEGLFLSCSKNPMTRVIKNEFLGYVLSGFKEYKVRSPVTGLLIRKSENRYVNVGEKLFDIGKEKL